MMGGIEYVRKQEYEAMKAEIERLTAALQKIADLVDSEDGEPLDDAIAIANRALVAAE